MKESAPPKLRIIEEVSISVEDADLERAGFAAQVILFLLVVDAAVISLLRGVMRAVIDGFAEHGAACHGYSLSLHEKTRQAPVAPKQNDRPQLYLMPGGKRPHHSSVSSPSSAGDAVASAGYRTWVR